MNLITAQEASKIAKDNRQQVEVETADKVAEMIQAACSLGKNFTYFKPADLPIGIMQELLDKGYDINGAGHMAKVSWEVDT